MKLSTKNTAKSPFLPNCVEDFNSAINKLNDKMLKMSLNKIYKIPSTQSALTIEDIVNELNNCTLSEHSQINESYSTQNKVFKFKKDLFNTSKIYNVDKLSNSCIYNNIKLKSIREAFHKNSFPIFNSLIGKKESSVVNKNPFLLLKKPQDNQINKQISESNKRSFNINFNSTNPIYSCQPNSSERQTPKFKNLSIK